MWQQGKEMHTLLLCEVQLLTTLQWPSWVFRVLIACCPIHLISQRLMRLNKTETKRSANKMLIYWRSLRNAKAIQNSNTVVSALLLPCWNKPIHTSPSENFAVHELQCFSLKSKKLKRCIIPQRLKFLFHYNCDLVKNGKEGTRDEVRKVTLPF